MQGTLTINLAKPVTSVEILDNYRACPPCNTPQNDTHDGATTLSGHSGLNSAVETQQHVLMTDAEKQKAEVGRLCQTLNCLVDKLNQCYDILLARHEVEIAKLSVEIARKILMHKVQKGDYEIESIVKEVLEHAPTLVTWVSARSCSKMIPPVALPKFSLLQIPILDGRSVCLRPQRE